MLPAERRQHILDELYKKKVISVNHLAQWLDVTPMTIRRDLQLLEEQGLVKKSHGGAVLTESNVKEATYHNRKLARIEEKRQIAKTALTFIESSMSIFMDAGTTTYELAALMVRKHWDDVTIITNDLAIAQLLIDVPGIHVIMVGGTVDAESASTCGTFASKAIKELHFDICFIGTQAIDPDFRLMSANAAKVDVKRACVEAAAQTVLLVDHSKFHKYKLYALFDLGVIDTLITDYEATPAEQQAFSDFNVAYIKV